MIESKRLNQQVDFIKATESLKTIKRQNQTLDGRFENSAEHSWQLALMAITFQEHFAEKIDILKVISMLLLHDLGEIDVGDTSAFDELGKATSYDRELVSVKETLSHLPKDQFQDYLDLWNEFEKGDTKEARYARCIDALAPLLNHSFIAELYAFLDKI